VFLSRRQKDEIAAAFKGKNYGVGCQGGVEVVAHSLRDTLLQHKSSDMALIKIDFKNAFNLMDRNAFVEASSHMFPGLERWTRWCYTQLLFSFTITPRCLSPLVECSKATLLALFTSAVAFSRLLIALPL
jgi:hypothetical protein